MSGLPVLRLPIEENPRPSPSSPPVRHALRGDRATGLGRRHRGAWTGSRAGRRGGGRSTPPDLWFDIDADGTRTMARASCWKVAGFALWEGSCRGMPSTTIRFDTATRAACRLPRTYSPGRRTRSSATDPTDAFPAFSRRTRRVRRAECLPAYQRTSAGQPDAPETADLAAVRQGRRGPSTPRAAAAARDHWLPRAGQPPLLVARPARDRQRPRMDPQQEPGQRHGLPFPPDIGPCGSPSCRMPRRS
jgi:hypothetical protein